MTQSFDVVVLGGGIGGYSAAIRAAQLGKRTAIVEQDKLGGTCLHRGCIPSKALLRSAELFAQMKESERFGITAGGVSLDYTKVLRRKDDIVAQLHRGVQYLMNKNKIEVFNGRGVVLGSTIFSPRSGTVSVEQEDGDYLSLVPGTLIVATGSRPRSLPGLAIDGKLLMTSDDAFRMETLPASMLIIGGGVIGVEWASMLGDFGVDVTIVEYAPRLLPGEDEDVSRELERLLKKRGVKVLTGAAVQAESVETSDGRVVLSVTRKNETVPLSAERALVCVGRQANVEGIGLENTNVAIENGWIKVNDSMQTAEAHIYAVGDCVGGVQLAHSAAREGVVAAEHAAGLTPLPYAAHRIPRCVYTRPEVASVGWTERQATERGFDVTTSKLHFQALGKALVYGEADGFVKVVADKKSGDLLGVHMIGPHVTEHISEAALAQLLEATPWEVGQTMHPHPALSELLGEAMLEAGRK